MLSLFTNIPLHAGHDLMEMGHVLLQEGTGLSGEVESNWSQQLASMCYQAISHDVRVSMSSTAYLHYQIGVRWKISTANTIGTTGCVWNIKVSVSWTVPVIGVATINLMTGLLQRLWIVYNTTLCFSIETALTDLTEILVT